MNEKNKYWIISILSGIVVGVISNLLMDSLKEVLPSLAMRIIAIIIVSVIFLVVVWFLLKYFAKEVANEVYNRNTLNFSFLGVLGKIFHKDNIAMRTKTIQIIFDYLVDAKGQNDTVLTELGRKVGKSTSTDSSGNVKMPSDFENSSPKDSIKNWLNIENHANWGEFSVEFTDRSEGKFSGRIFVKNCFLVSGRTNENHNLIPFLIGYLEEIIIKLAKFNVTVTELQEGKDFEHGKCEFNFKPDEEK